MSVIQLYAKSGKVSITLVEPSTYTVGELIAEIAEILVSTKEAKSDDVANLELSLDGKTALSEGSASLESLGIVTGSCIYYRFGKGEFSYDSPVY